MKQICVLIAVGNGNEQAVANLFRDLLHEHHPGIDICWHYARHDDLEDFMLEHACERPRLLVCSDHHVGHAQSLDQREGSILQGVEEVVFLGIPTDQQQVSPHRVYTTLEQEHLKITLTPLLTALLDT